MTRAEWNRGQASLSLLKASATRTVDEKGRRPQETSDFGYLRSAIIFLLERELAGEEPEYPGMDLPQDEQ